MENGWLGEGGGAITGSDMFFLASGWVEKGEGGGGGGFP